MRFAVGRTDRAGGPWGAPAVFLLCGLVALTLPAPALSQAPAGAPTVQAEAPFVDPAAVPFRTLDQDRLFRDSRLGQQVLASIREAERQLDQENAAIAAQLAAEEQELTRLRPTLSPEEFRARADAFDARVEAVRTERNQRSQELARQTEAEAQRFFDAALPVLQRLMVEEGIVALLRPDALILGPDWLDITPLAIERLDAALARDETDAPGTGQP